MTLPTRSSWLSAATCLFVLAGVQSPISVGDAAAVSGGCPVPVCRYQGTSWAEDLIGDELRDRGEAKVVWLFSHMSGREAVYLPSGKVKVSWRTERCEIDLSPAEHEFASDNPSVRHARLRVDFTSVPVRYTGIGTSNWPGTQTWRCKNDTPFTQEDGISTTWLKADEMTTDDAGLLAGTAESETVRSGWEFVNSP